MVKLGDFVKVNAEGNVGSLYSSTRGHICLITAIRKAGSTNEYALFRPDGFIDSWCREEHFSLATDPAPTPKQLAQYQYITKKPWSQDAFIVTTDDLMTVNQDF